MTLKKILKSYNQYLDTLSELNEHADSLSPIDGGWFDVREDEGGILLFHYNLGEYPIENNKQLKDFMKLESMDDFYKLSWNNI